MPYDAQGNWVTPEGFEEYDMEEMFELATTDPAGLVGEMRPSFESYMETRHGEDWENTVDENWLILYEQLYPIVTDMSSGEIAQMITPYDPYQEGQYKRESYAQRQSLREDAYSQSRMAAGIGARGGLSGTWRAASATKDLWNEYLTSSKEISKSLSLNIFNTKAEYLDMVYGDIAESWQASLED